jgi:hypothetical protein
MNSSKPKLNDNWLTQPSTSNGYSALLEEESEDKQPKAGPEKRKSLLQSI